MRINRSSALVLGLMLGVCAVGFASGQSPVSGKPDQPGVTPIRLPAAIETARAVRVTPKVDGQVEEMLVEAGARVNAGQVLARLDRKPYELELNRSEALVLRAKASLEEASTKAKTRLQEVQQAEAAVRRATAARGYAGKKAERIRELHQKGAVEERLVEEAKSQEEAAEANVQQMVAKSNLVKLGLGNDALAVAKADLAHAEASRDLAKLQLEGTEVRAPIGGTIIARHAARGELVGPSARTGKSAGIVDIADLTKLHAAVALPENLVSRITVGQNCTIYIDAAPKPAYRGRIIRVSPTLSRETRTASAHIALELTTNDHGLRPGMYAQVEIPVAPSAKALVETQAARTVTLENAQARLASAQKAYELALQQQTQLLAMDPEFLALWSRRWLEAQRELATSKDQQIAALEAHLGRLRNLEKFAKRLSATGQGRQTDAVVAEYHRLEAEQWLSQVKGK